jgi:hypothetical protein
VKNVLLDKKGVKFPSDPNRENLSAWVYWNFNHGEKRFDTFEFKKQPGFEVMRDVLDDLRSSEPQSSRMLSGLMHRGQSKAEIESKENSDRDMTRERDNHFTTNENNQFTEHGP